MFKKLKISTKLTVGFSIISIILAVVGITGYLAMNKIKKSHKNYATVELPSVLSIGTIFESIRSITVGERGMLIPQIFTNPEYRRKQYSKGAFNRIKNARATYDSLTHTVEEIKIWKDFDKLWEDWMIVHDQYMALCDEKGELYDSGLGLEDSSILALESKIDDLYLKSRERYLLVNDTLGYLMDLTVNKAVESDKAMDKLAKQSNWLVFSFMFIGILIAVVIGIYITRTITQSVNAGLKLSYQLAEGDLRSKVVIKREDEIGQLLKHIQVTVVQLKGIVLSIKENSINLVTASDELKKSSQNISDSNSEQAAASEEITTTMENVIAGFKENSDDASKTGAITKNTNNMINLIKDMSAASLQSVSAIAEKISVIEEIAFQTNILALNAAVEAARAGEHGAGFSVVATEVRKLAEKSKKAATEIIELANFSLSKTEESEKSFESIAPEIQMTYKLIDKISKASVEQISDTRMVYDAISQLNQYTQKNAASSEEIAANAEELHSQAHELIKLVDYFKID